MKKMIGTLLGVLFGVILAGAQKHEPVNPQKDQMEFKGYTIRIIPAMRGTYIYDIIKGKQVVVHQHRNPFTGGPVGLATKQDAYKVAQWQIDNHERQFVFRMQENARNPKNKQTSQGLRFSQTIPSIVAEQLGIKPQAH